MPADKGTGSRLKKTRPGPRDTKTVSTVMAEAKARAAQRAATIDAAPRAVFVPPALSAGGKPSPVHDNYARDRRATKSDLDTVFKLAQSRPVRLNLSRQPDNVLDAVPAPLTPRQRYDRDQRARENRNYLQKAVRRIDDPANALAGEAARFAAGVGEAGKKAIVGGSAVQRQGHLANLRTAKVQTAGPSGAMVRPVAEITGNLIEGVTNSAVGFVPGLALGVSHPVEFSKLAYEDLKYHLNPKDIDKKLYEDPAWYALSAWGLAAFPKQVGHLATRLRGGHEQVPVRYIESEVGDVRRQASGSSLTRAVQDAVARIGEGPLENVPLVGANKRSKKQLAMDDEKEKTRITAPLAEFLHGAGPIVRHPFRSIAYDRTARFGGSTLETIHAIEDEITWRKQTGGVSNRALVVKLQGALKKLRREDDARLNSTVEIGRQITEAAEDIFVKYGMLSREGAEARLALPMKAIYQLPEINSPVRDAYLRELAALPEFKDREPLLAAVMDVLDSSAYSWWQREKGKEHGPDEPGGMTEEATDARIAQIEAYLEPFINDIYLALRDDSPTRATGKDQRPRRTQKYQTQATHDIGGGEIVDKDFPLLRQRTLADAKAHDRGRALKLLEDAVRGSDHRGMRRIAKAFEELDDLRATRDSNIDPEIVFGDMPAPGYNNIPPRSTPLSPADFYERVLGKPVFDGIPEGALHQERRHYIAPSMGARFEMGDRQYVITNMDETNYRIESVEDPNWDAWLPHDEVAGYFPSTVTMRGSEPGVHPLQGFYSPLERAIEDKMPAKASAQQIEGILKSAGIKEEEIVELQIRKYLAADQKSFTKEEILAWIDSTKLRLEERVADKQSSGGYGHDDEHKYSGYATPGAKESNYREILIRIPENQVGNVYSHGHWPDKNVLVHLRTTERMVDGKRTVLVEEIQSDWHQAAQKGGYQQPHPENDPDVQRVYGEFETARDALMAKMRERGLDFPPRHDQEGLPYLQDLTDYLSARKMRYRDIVTVWRVEQNGKWGEDAESWWMVKSTKDSPDGPRYQEAKVASRFETSEAAHAWMNEANRLHASGYPGETPELVWKQIENVKELIDLHTTADAHLRDYRRFTRMASSGVPNAPFKKTWHELGFKRALHWAVENGFEQVSWTTGASQAKLYNLAEVFRRIEIEEGSRRGEVSDYYDIAQESWNDSSEEENFDYSSDVAYPDRDDDQFWSEDGEEFLEDEWEAAEEAYYEEYDAERDAALEKYRDEWIRDTAQAYWESSEDEQTTIHTVDADGNRRDFYVEDGEELADYIGQERADQYEKEGKYVFEGDDLMVGENSKEARAMEVFYDKKIVNFADKYLKAFGAKVEKKKIEDGRRDKYVIQQNTGTELWEIWRQGPDGRGAFLNEFRSRENANNMLRELEEQATGPADGIEVHTIPITEGVKAFVEAGQKLFQRGKRNPFTQEEAGPRGAASKDASGKVTMHFTPSADVSTPIHEMAHVVRLGVWDTLEDGAKAAIENALNVKNGAWTVAKEEAFARSIELYVRRGKAPSPKLRKPYRLLSKELRTVYRQKSELGKSNAKALDENAGFNAALDALLDSTHGVKAGEGAFYVTDTAKRPVLGTRPKSPTSKNRDRFYHNTGFTWEGGKLRAGPKLTYEHATRAWRIKHQVDTAARIRRDFAQPIDPDEGLRKGWTFMNDRGAEIPRHLKEVDEGREFIERLDGIGPEDVDEAMDKEIRDLQDLLYPDEKEAAEQLAAGADLMQIPQWVKDAYVEELMFTVPAGNVLKHVGKVLEFSNNLARLGLIYLSPAYIPVNFVANEIIAIIQQGVFHPVNMARALGLMGDLERSTLRRLDLEVSGGSSRALAGEGRGKIGAFTQGVAEFMNAGADVIPRRTAIIHELWKYGYRDDASIVRLLDDENGSRDVLNQISQGANEAMVRFDGLSPEEKKVISKGVFIYRWVKGATRYAARIPAEHPVSAPLMYEIGELGHEELEKRRGDVIGHFFRGQLPYGEKYKDAIGTVLLKVLNFNSLSPMTTGIEAWEAVYGSMTGKGVARAADLLSPPLDIGIQIATGEDNFGNPLKGQPVKSALLQEAKGYKAVRLGTGLLQGGKESRYYGKESRGDIALRSVTGIWPPRPLKIEEAIKKGYDEMPTEERYLRKMRAGDPKFTPFEVTKKLITREARKRFPFESQKTQRMIWAGTARYLSSDDPGDDTSLAGINAILSEGSYPTLSQKEYDRIRSFVDKTKEKVRG